MPKYHGKGSEFWLASGASGTPSKIISLSAYTADLSTDKVDSTEFGAANETQEIGYPKANGTFEGFYNDDAGQDELWTARSSPDGAQMILYPHRATPANIISGNVWVDITIETSVRDMVKVRGSWTARGDIGVGRA